MGVMGNPDDFATLAVWLLSSYSQYITRQIFAIDSGFIKSTL